jgi:hypothetical protein
MMGGSVGVIAIDWVLVLVQVSGPLDPSALTNVPLAVEQFAPKLSCSVKDWHTGVPLQVATTLKAVVPKSETPIVSGAGQYAGE